MKRCSTFMSFMSLAAFHFGNNSSYLNTEVKQHWARIVLEWETAWELLCYWHGSGYFCFFKMSRHCQSGPPVVVMKSRCPSQVDHLQRLQQATIGNNNKECSTYNVGRCVFNYNTYSSQHLFCPLANK